MAGRCASELARSSTKFLPSNVVKLPQRVKPPSFAFLDPMRSKSALALLAGLHRNEASLLAGRLLTQHGLHGSRWLLRDLVEQPASASQQLDLIAPADLSWLDTCEVAAQLLIRSVEAASLPALANASALLDAQLAPELRLAWTNAAKQLDLAAGRPWSETIELLTELASQVAAARDAIAFHLAERHEAAAHWERIVTDWANLVIAHHRPLLWALRERPADRSLMEQLLSLTVATADLAASAAPIHDLATLLPAEQLAASAEIILQAAATPAWHPRWTAPLLALADRTADAADRSPDLERLLLPMLGKSRDALVFHVERLARHGKIDEAHYWLTEGQSLFPRDTVWDRLLEAVGR